MNYQRILVPIDFSDDALSAFQVAIDSFASPDRTLILLHVVDSHPRGVEDYQQHNADFVEEKKHKLNSLGHSRRDLWKDVEILIESGRPTDVIIQTAKQESADLVIMGSHGDGGFTKSLFGSTTYDVARKVKCSVMISKRQSQ